jgi:hypothetical protein
MCAKDGHGARIADPRGGPPSLPQPSVSFEGIVFRLGVWVGQHRTDAGRFIEPHAHLVGSVPGPQQPVELQYLLLDPPQLSSERRETRTSYIRNPLVVWVGDDIEQFLDTIASDRGDGFSKNAKTYRRFNCRRTTSEHAGLLALEVRIIVGN